MSDPQAPIAPLTAPPPRRRKAPWRGMVVALFVLLLALTLFAMFGAGPLDALKNVVVPRGAGPRDVAATLEANNAIYSGFLFRVAAKFFAANNLKAGEYELTPGESLIDIIAKIRDGKSVTRLFTVAEGLTSSEVTRLLLAMPTLTGDVGAMPAEGSLLPESYRYIYGDTRTGIIARMQKSMQDTLLDLWSKRDPNLPITTPEQAMVMASIVERETGKVSERPRIAGVFYNRLRQHMRLQSDPTVIYGIMAAKGLMDHDIEHADLGFASPYNTYLNDGLPPRPICNPGRAAIAAVLHPEANNYLFFVADGTGGHVFARNLKEHNANVTRWNEVKPK